MRRGSWLIATVALLFGLQIPLCAVACLAQPAGAATAPVGADARPCHGDDPTPSSDPPDSHEDCGCDSVDEPLATKKQVLDPPSGAAQIIAAITRHQRRPQARRVVPHPRNAALPPPDILLRNATLLI